MNYFQYHGSSIWDERRAILENAEYWHDDIKIIRYERYAEGGFVKNDFSNNKSFVFKNKLYSFQTNFHGQISNIIELNISKQKCLKENYGGYFEFEILKKI